ncbi:MAG: hypothetical protein AUG51_26750 [Acidobacteria bacterium 13_1_20CM_3_53_8]|nr:MAG: hypothetical protein AUG51_26750 [Acidobacteria bacterium 13_1_20CM_3_53_8]
MNEKIKAVLMAGVGLSVLLIVTGLLSKLLPLAGCCNCLWPIVAGALAVWLYVNKTPTPPVQMGEGAALGALTGLIAAVINTVISVPIALLNVAAVEAQFDQLRAQGVNIPFSGVALILVASVIGFFIFVILAALGGVIGVPIFEKRKGGPLPPPPPAYGGGQPGGGYGGS